MVSWIFFESLRARFYSKSTDADTRQHLYNQLSKVVYPHQLERIKLADYSAWLDSERIAVNVLTLYREFGDTAPPPGPIEMFELMAELAR